MFGPSQKFSSRDLASHTALKSRKDGQDTQEELRKRNLRDELEERERKHSSSKDRGYNDDRERRRTTAGNIAYLENGGPRRDIEEKLAIKNIDADDSDVDLKSDSDESDEDDDEDETAALLAELERIKKERAEEKLRKERQMQEVEMKTKEVELVRGNPLLNPNFSVKRRWDDDVVFKNQARGEPKVTKRFINDTIRNDFHRKFLSKYMK